MIFQNGVVSGLPSARRVLTAVFGMLLVVMSISLLPAGKASAAGPLVADSITAGVGHSCAVRTDGQAVCWGANYFGQLGDGTTTRRLSPIPVEGLDDAVAISAGQNHACAIEQGGQAVCWGDNSLGQLGSGPASPEFSPEPLPVWNLDDAVAISAGGAHTCAIREDGQALCWGYNDSGQLGNNDYSNDPNPVPAEVVGLPDAREIAAGANHSCAIRNTGEAVCWGHNSRGQLGDDPLSGSGGSLVPVNVNTGSGLTDAKELSAGMEFTCATGSTDQAYCWGSGSYGQLGYGAPPYTPKVPTPLPALTQGKSISAGTNHTCAVRSNPSGQALCWGWNFAGELGDGTKVQKDVPTNVIDLTDAKRIAAGNLHTCAIRNSGQVSCFGHNGSGALGDGTTEDHYTPTPVVVKDWYRLNVTRTSGGKVRTADNLIDCGTTCSERFPEGEKVTLTATADPGQIFTGWSGACTGTGTCAVTMDQARAVHAGFTAYDPNEPPLTVIRTGDGTGTVTSVPTGINCGVTCTATFDRDKAVTLTATPDAGSAFTGWNGACTGSGPCQVTMSKARTVWASFTEHDPNDPSAKPPLVVFRTGNGNGGVTSNPAGIECGNDCLAKLNQGTVVTLTATPEAGSAFTGWNGACTGTDTCQVTMSKARTVWASFTNYNESDPSARPPLVVFKAGDGNGRVTSDPSGISCGSDCSAEFERDELVELTASASAGSVFTGWNGACTGTRSTCTVRMSTARSVWASFSAYDRSDPSAKPPLVVFKTGNGEGRVTSSPNGIDCRGSGEICQANFDKGIEVTLIANEGSGSAFMGWNGACTGTGPCVVSMDDARSVWATFVTFDPAHPPLAVFLTGDGDGRVTSTPAGINCDRDCVTEFVQGSAVNLAAAAAPGSVFAGWSGACTGSGGCSLTMNRARSVWVSFDREPQPVETKVPVPPNDKTAIYDPATGRLTFRLKCARKFRPRCLKMVGQAVGGKKKKAKKMSSRVTVRNLKAGKWKLATIKVKPKFRQKVEKMSTVKRKTLWVRINVVAKVKKAKRVRGKKVRRLTRVRKRVHHRYVVRTA